MQDPEFSALLLIKFAFIIAVIMSYYINYLGTLVRSGSVFWFCALAGSGMVIIQFILNLLGATDQDNFDMSAEASGNTHDTPDIRKFKWLSLQAITGFLMMFGWTAITCQNQFHLSIAPTVSISISAGLFAAIVIRSIFKLAKKLKSPGSVYRIEDAIGKEAYIYQSIPKGGMGKISMSLNHLTYEIDAVSNHPEDLPSFVRVKVIEKKDNNIVVVTPL